MKFLVITAVKAYEKEIKQILKNSEVRAFSHVAVTGHGDINDETLDSNWFASEAQENESILFNVFVKKENVDRVFEAVNSFNETIETSSRIHVAMLNIEKTNEVL